MDSVDSGFINRMGNTRYNKEKILRMHEQNRDLNKAIVIGDKYYNRDVESRSNYNQRDNQMYRRNVKQFETLKTTYKSPQMAYMQRGNVEPYFNSRRFANMNAANKY